MNAPIVLSSRRLNGTGLIIEFVRHEKYPGWTLVIDGFYHSNLDLDGEPKLNFDYAKRVVCLADKLFLPGSPISILHIGGGALSIPRYLEATRSGAKQVVIEIEEDVVVFTQEHFPLASDTNIELVYADASDPKGALRGSQGPEQFDLIICDAYLGSLAGGPEQALRFYQDLHELLALDGVVVINAVDSLETQVEFACEHFNIVKKVFEDAAVVADVWDLENSRKTNILLVAGASNRIDVLDSLVSDFFAETAIIRDSHSTHWGLLSKGFKDD